MDKKKDTINSKQSKDEMAVVISDKTDLKSITKNDEEHFIIIKGSVHQKGIAIINMSVLLLLSHFSRVRLCATPETAAHQALPSLGFSRQEHWSGLPFPSPMHESESEVAQLCPTPSDPMDCSLPGSSIHGIFQARVLEWGAIQSFKIYE